MQGVLQDVQSVCPDNLNWPLCKLPPLPMLFSGFSPDECGLSVQRFSSATLSGRETIGIGFRYSYMPLSCSSSRIIMLKLTWSTDLSSASWPHPVSIHCRSPSLRSFMLVCASWYHCTVLLRLWKKTSVAVWCENKNKTEKRCVCMARIVWIHCICQLTLCTQRSYPLLSGEAELNIAAELNSLVFSFTASLKMVLNIGC